jgi:hypothetical protein
METAVADEPQEDVADRRELVAELAAHDVGHGFLRWRPASVHHGQEGFTSAVLPQLLTRPVRLWLTSPDPFVWLTLGRVLAGIDDQALIGELMREADQVSVAQDLREKRLDPDALIEIDMLHAHLKISALTGGTTLMYPAGSVGECGTGHGQAGERERSITS